MVRGHDDIGLWTPALRRVHEGRGGTEIDDELVRVRADRAPWVVVVMVRQLREDFLTGLVRPAIQERRKGSTLDLLRNR